MKEEPAPKEKADAQDSSIEGEGTAAAAAEVKAPEVEVKSEKSDLNDDGAEAAKPAAQGNDQASSSADPATSTGTPSALEREVQRRLDEWSLTMYADNTCVLRVRRHTPHHTTPHTTHHTPHTTDRQELSDRLACPPQVPVQGSGGPLGR